MTMPSGAQVLTSIDLGHGGLFAGDPAANLRRLERLLQIHLDQVRRLERQLDDLRGAVVTAIAALVDARDASIGDHCRVVMDCAVLLAGEMGLDPTHTEAVGIAGLLHDLGKIGVADGVLNKPGPLDEVEWNAMREHPVVAERLLADLPLPAAALAAIKHHHERFDGLGYPDGLAGESIPIGARIVAVADAFHAMTSERPYTRRKTFREARDEIRRCARTHFCPRVVDAFLMLSSRPEFRDSWAA